MHVRFETPHQYVFIHENVKHLLLVWSKDSKKQLFIAEDEEDALVLRYPGEVYTETVLEQVEPVFFLDLEGGVEAVLGATFYHQGQADRHVLRQKKSFGPSLLLRNRKGLPRRNSR